MAGPAAGYPRRVMRDILCGVQELHAAGVVHLDVKPANVLLDSAGGARLSDAGLAACLGGAMGATTRASAIATLEYCPPEQMDAGAAECGPPADVWAAAATLCHALAGERPFAGMRPQQIAAAVLLQGRHPDVPENLPQPLRSAASAQYPWRARHCMPRLRAHLAALSCDRLLTHPSTTATLRSLVLHSFAPSPSSRPTPAELIAAIDEVLASPAPRVPPPATAPAGLPVGAPVTAPIKINTVVPSPVPVAALTSALSATALSPGSPHAATSPRAAFSAGAGQSSISASTLDDLGAAVAVLAGGGDAMEALRLACREYRARAQGRGRGHPTCRRGPDGRRAGRETAPFHELALFGRTLHARDLRAGLLRWWRRRRRRGSRAGRTPWRRCAVRCCRCGCTAPSRPAASSRATGTP